MSKKKIEPGTVLNCTTAGCGNTFVWRIHHHARLKICDDCRTNHVLELIRKNHPLSKTAEARRQYYRERNQKEYERKQAKRQRRERLVAQIREMRFEKRMTLMDVAAELGMSYQRVRQLVPGRIPGIKYKRRKPAATESA